MAHVGIDFRLSSVHSKHVHILCSIFCCNCMYSCIASHQMRFACSPKLLLSVSQVNQSINFPFQGRHNLFNYLPAFITFPKACMYICIRILYISSSCLLNLIVLYWVQLSCQFKRNQILFS